MRIDVADITLRAGPWGMGVANQARLPPKRFALCRRAILLIHGYNVSENRALESMDQFKRALSYFAPALVPDNTFICTWAGNWPVLKPAAYRFALRNARESSKTLLEAIEEVYEAPPAPEELIIIAHSLGCRLTLEMLRGMAERGRPQLLKRLAVILMAAAVPTEYLDPGGPLEDAAGVPDVIAVFHSTSDVVLSSGFGIGQTLAREGWFPEAVGLRGSPQSVSWTRTERMRSFDHGDYWAELETAELACAVLGIAIKRSALSGTPLHMRKLLRKHRAGMAPLLLSSPD